MEPQVLPLHPIAFFFTIVSSVLILVLPRRSALLPLIFALVFIPLQQRVVIASLDFFILRILILFGWARVVTRSEYRSVTLNALDKAVILWVISGTIAYSLLWHTGTAFINRLGISFDILGIYFLVRFLVRDFDDITWVIKTFALVSIPVALAMLIERQTGRNLFSIFGGVPEFTTIRDGSFRCQGAFSHAITAGTFGATLFPLFVGLKWRSGAGLMMWAGMISAAIITVNSSSSGPAIAFAGAVIALLLWRMRDRMRAVRWGVVITLVTLHIVMKAPVWALVMKIKVFGASTAYHRYNLIDKFLGNFTEWFLIGIKSTAGWGYYLYDVTNYFIRIGVDGGLATLLIFIAVLAYSFKGVGMAVKTLSRDYDKKFVWALGAALFAHMVSFMGVSYFDQIKFVFYIMLAIISVARSLTEACAREKAICPEAALEGVGLEHGGRQAP